MLDTGGDVRVFMTIALIAMAINNDFFTSLSEIYNIFFLLKFPVQLEGGHFQEQTQEYARWKELRDRLAADLRLSVSKYFENGRSCDVII